MGVPSFIEDEIYKALRDRHAIQRVRELHMDSGSGQCLHCTQAETGGDEQWIEWHAVAYPCPTIQALGEPE